MDRGSSSPTAQPPPHVLPPHARAARPSRRSRRTIAVARRSPSLERKIRTGLTKRVRFFSELLHHLDSLVLAEICVLYYMECSFFRLLIRAIPQTVLFSPKSDEYAILSPATRAHVMGIFFPSTICALFHVYYGAHPASEATRGYLHGGVFIDFVGQKAPSSRWSLLFFDLLIFTLQCLMLAVHTQRERLRKAILPHKMTVAATPAVSGAPAAAAPAPTPAPRSHAHVGMDEALVLTARTIVSARTRQHDPRGGRPPAAQSYDAEERGLLQGLQGQAGEQIEMEMLTGQRPAQTLPAAEAAAIAAAIRHGADVVELGDESSESSGLGGTDADGPRRLPPRQTADYVLDALATGCNLGDFYLVDAIEAAELEARDLQPPPLPTVSLLSWLARLGPQRGARTPTATATATAAP